MSTSYSQPYHPIHPYLHPLDPIHHHFSPSFKTDKMPDADQCPSHTRTPWGTSSHRLRPSLRHFAMGLLLFSFVAVIILVLVFVIGHSTFWADHEDDKLEGAEAAGGIAFVMPKALKADSMNENEEVIGKRVAGACAEQLKDCVAGGRENFCCPRGTICQNNAFSPSEVSCCPHDTFCNLDVAPSCVEGTYACPISLGGGCCPIRTACSIDGCLHSLLTPARYQDEENTLKDDRSMTIRTEEVSAVQDQELATHTGPKLGELAAILSDDAQEDFVKKEQWQTFSTVHDDGLVLKAKEPNTFFVKAANQDGEAVVKTDHSDSFFKPEDDDLPVMAENSDPYIFTGEINMVVKAEQPGTFVEIGEEDEEKSSVTFIKGKRRRGRKHGMSGDSDQIRDLSRALRAPFPHLATVVMPAVVVDAIFLWR